MKPGGGRKPRLTEQERSTILYLIHLSPPGQPTYEPTGELHVDDPQGEVEWTLDALTAMARKHGIQVARSQVRRIFRREGVRWRRTRLWATSKDPDFVPKGQRSSASPPTHRREPPSSVSTNSAP
jgi:transposase